MFMCYPLSVQLTFGPWVCVCVCFVLSCVYVWRYVCVWMGCLLSHHSDMLFFFIPVLSFHRVISLFLPLFLYLLRTHTHPLRTEPLPNGIGRLSNILDLVLNDNKFNGSLPDSLCNLTTLQSISISNVSVWLFGVCDCITAFWMCTLLCYCVHSVAGVAVYGDVMVRGWLCGIFPLLPSFTSCNFHVSLKFQPLFLRFLFCSVLMHAVFGCVGSGYALRFCAIHICARVRWFCSRVPYVHLRRNWSCVCCRVLSNMLQMIMFFISGTVSSKSVSCLWYITFLHFRLLTCVFLFFCVLTFYSIS